MPVRLHDVDALAGAERLAAADRLGELDGVGGLLGELVGEELALGAAGRVAVHRLVARGRDVGHGLHRVLLEGVVSG